MGPFKDDYTTAFYLMNDASYEPKGQVLILLRNIQLIQIAYYQFHSYSTTNYLKLEKLYYPRNRPYWISCAPVPRVLV